MKDHFIMCNLLQEVVQQFLSGVSVTKIDFSVSSSSGHGRLNLQMQIVYTRVCTSMECCLFYIFAECHG